MVKVKQGSHYHRITGAGIQLEGKNRNESSETQNYRTARLEIKPRASAMVIIENKNLSRSFSVMDGRQGEITVCEMRDRS